MWNVVEEIVDLMVTEQSTGKVVTEEGEDGIELKDYIEDDNDKEAPRDQKHINE